MFSGINVYNLITKKGSNKLFKCLVSKIRKYIFVNNLAKCHHCSLSRETNTMKVKIKY